MTSTSDIIDSMLNGRGCYLKVHQIIPGKEEVTFILDRHYMSAADAVRDGKKFNTQPGAGGFIVRKASDKKMIFASVYSFALRSFIEVDMTSVNKLS